MKNKSTILLGKTVQKVAKIKGGGSALPGLFIEKTNPNFIQNTLKKLPHGVVVISGTNGKTTTTKMVVELLKSRLYFG
jgi:folylpolyglutamate synthase/dihydropteroate synthase